jgi:signal transduction histidine kinase
MRCLLWHWFLISILIVLFVTNTWGQTRRIDSLRVVYYSNSAPEVKHQTLIQLCENYYSLSADSLNKYIEAGLRQSEANSNDHFRFKNFYSFCFLKQGKAEEANRYSDSLMKRAITLAVDPSIQLEMLHYKTAILIRNNKYKEAIQSALKLLAEAEKVKDTALNLRACSLLGWANMELENEKEAIKWLNKGIHFTQNASLLQQVNSLYLNIASCYNLTFQPDSALYNINIGLRYAEEVENLTSVANALNIRAAIYSRANNTKAALKDLENALVVRQKVGDLYYLISDMGLLSHYYAFINQPNKGIEIAQKGITLAIKTKNLYKLIYLKKGLGRNYEVANRTKDYIQILLEVMDLKDSLYEQNTANDLAELQTKYELKKKENIIIQQENTLIRNRYFTVISLLTVLLGGIIIWLSYRHFVNKRQLKMEKELAEEKIHSIQAVKLAEEKERKRIAADLHDNLGSNAAAIASNIDYLKDHAGQLDETIMAQLEENAQAMVTQLGDTIWVLKNEQLPITKLADRFKVWAQRLMQNYPSVTYNYTEHMVDDPNLPPTKVFQLFLILKEGLNNALRHSQCSEIRIHFFSENFLRITLDDNGTGFSPNQATVGNGIENMQKRAAACDMKVEWQHLEPQGTRVMIYGSTTN